MDDTFRTDPLGGATPDITMWQFPPLPVWLARRLLRENEQITWLRGPKFNPGWERYATHPALILVALALGAVVVGLGVLLKGPLLVLGLVAAAIIYATIFVLGIACGYFTRLVVTNFRLVFLQGYEVRRSWDLDDLPRSLIRFSKQRGGEVSRAVDLTALQTMLGGPSDQFVDTKKVQAFGKQLEQIKLRENRRPGPEG